MIENLLASSELPPSLVLGMRLERIFTPIARKKRDDFYSKSKRFVHYTSAESALKIIKSKRLWMRNTTCMVDYQEVEHGYKMLLSFFSDPAKREAFTVALDSCAPGAAMEALTLFDGWWAHIRFNTYIASIAEHEDCEDLHGRLSMWRAFGGAIGKVAIVFRVPYYSGGAEQLNLMFSPVAYLNETQVHEAVHAVIKNIENEAEFLQTLDRQIVISWVFNMLLAGATCIKHEGFEEEREWRAIYTPKRMASALIIPSTEVIGAVPQLIYQIPLDKAVSPALADLDLASMFDRLIVGPSPYPWVMYEAFTDALAKAGVADASSRVRISEIPLRT